jgi:hypothetical protein
MSDTVLVDATTLAQRLGQAKSSIYRLHKRGVIPAYAAGPNLRGLRFDLEEVKQALRRPARQPNEPKKDTAGTS